MRNRKIAGLFSLIICMCTTSCNILDFWKDGDDDDNRTHLVFYGWGNSSEVALTEQFVQDFNESQDDIYIDYTAIASNDYATKIRNALSRSNVPDIIIAGDGEIKSWIEMDGLSELDDFIEQSDEFDLSDFWQEGQNRYYYNPNIRMNYRDDIDDRYKKDFHYYGIMRDLSPTALFYNVAALNKVGINVISIEKNKIDSYNSNNSTSYEAVGYKEYDTCPDPLLTKSKSLDGEKDVWRVFNNKIPMTWDWDKENNCGIGELMEISKITTKRYNPLSRTTYGIYYNNWFSLGWSVGANSLQWIEDNSKSLGGYYDFTLGDTTSNFKVKENESLIVNNHEYTGGELVRFGDLKIVDGNPELYSKCYRLPSALDATQFYVDLSAKHNYSPKPDFTASTSQYSLFSSGNMVAMTLDSRYSVGIWRKSIKKPGQSGGFDWDCAPAPVHVNGIPSGHSGSLAYCIPKKSKHKEEAFKFIEYMNGVEGQTAFAEAGYTIPNTKTMSNSSIFLDKSKKPHNSIVFVDAAEYQTVGDWGFLPDKDWITIWATEFNSRVLSGQTSLTESINRTYPETKRRIDKYYEGINI